MLYGCGSFGGSEIHFGTTANRHKLLDVVTGIGRNGMTEEEIEVIEMTVSIVGGRAPFDDVTKEIVFVVLRQQNIQQQKLASLYRNMATMSTPPRPTTSDDGTSGRRRGGGGGGFSSAASSFSTPSSSETPTKSRGDLAYFRSRRDRWKNSPRPKLKPLPTSSTATSETKEEASSETVPANPLFSSPPVNSNAAFLPKPPGKVRGSGSSSSSSSRSRNRTSSTPSATNATATATATATSSPGVFTPVPISGNPFGTSSSFSSTNTTFTSTGSSTNTFVPVSSFQPQGSKSTTTFSAPMPTTTPSPFGGASRVETKPSTSTSAAFQPMTTKAPTPFGGAPSFTATTKADSKSSTSSSAAFPPMSTKAPTPFGGAAAAASSEAKSATKTSTSATFPPMSAKAPTPFGGAPSAVSSEDKLETKETTSKPLSFSSSTTSENPFTNLQLVSDKDKTAETFKPVFGFGSGNAAKPHQVSKPSASSAFTNSFGAPASSRTVDSVDDEIAKPAPKTEQGAREETVIDDFQVDDDDSEYDSDEREERDEEEAKARKCFAELANDSKKIQVTDTETLITNLGTTYGEKEFAKVIKKIKQPDENTIKEDDFVCWYMNWLFGDESDNSDFEDDGEDVGDEGGVGAETPPSGKQDLSSVFQVDKDSWKCDVCAVRNAADKERCVACETARPGFKNDHEARSKEEAGTDKDAIAVSSIGPGGFTFGLVVGSTQTESSKGFAFGGRTAPPPPLSSTGQGDSSNSGFYTTPASGSGFTFSGTLSGGFQFNKGIAQKEDVAEESGSTEGDKGGPLGSRSGLTATSLSSPQTSSENIPTLNSDGSKVMGPVTASSSSSQDPILISKSVGSSPKMSSVAFPPMSTKSPTPFGGRKPSKSAISPHTSKSALLGDSGSLEIPGTTVKESVDHMARLIAFYQKHNPDKLDTVEETLEKYKGKEDELFRRLEAKYCPKPSSRIPLPNGEGPECFLEFSIAGKKVGKVVVKLYQDKAPLACENFQKLCNGSKGRGRTGKPLCYKDCRVHRVVPGFCVQMGDFTRGDGTGGESIYEPNTANVSDSMGRFRDESFLQHSRKGLLSMANNGANRNGSQFFFTLRPCPMLDGKHVVFGEVTSGLDVIEEIGKLDTTPKQQPKQDVVITNCGDIVNGEEVPCKVDSGPAPSPFAFGASAFSSSASSFVGRDSKPFSSSPFGSDGSSKTDISKPLGFGVGSTPSPFSFGAVATATSNGVSDETKTGFGFGKAASTSGLSPFSFGAVAAKSNDATKGSEDASKTSYPSPLVVGVNGSSDPGSSPFSFSAVASSSQPGSTGGFTSSSTTETTATSATFGKSFGFAASSDPKSSPFSFGAVASSLQLGESGFPSSANTFTGVAAAASTQSTPFGSSLNPSFSTFGAVAKSPFSFGAQATGSGAFGLSTTTTGTNQSPSSAFDYRGGGRPTVDDSDTDATSNDSDSD